MKKDELLPLIFPITSCGLGKVARSDVLFATIMPSDVALRLLLLFMSEPSCASHVRYLLLKGQLKSQPVSFSTIIRCPKVNRGIILNVSYEVTLKKPGLCCCSLEQTLFDPWDKNKTDFHKLGGNGFITVTFVTFFRKQMLYNHSRKDGQYSLQRYFILFSHVLKCGG